MIETIILLKPKAEWRAGMDKDAIINELNSKLQIPGVTNGWTQPIINRINMLSTGVRTDVGLKCMGKTSIPFLHFQKSLRRNWKALME
jgi:Cu(I)/Ag(I) efflux system membrane protein CusA/SilA